jgi:hypothetical protein
MNMAQFRSRVMRKSSFLSEKGAAGKLRISYTNPPPAARLALVFLFAKAHTAGLEQAATGL